MAKTIQQCIPCAVLEELAVYQTFECLGSFFLLLCVDPLSLKQAFLQAFLQLMSGCADPLPLGQND